MAEPWRNGVVEKFNDHYQQKFLHKVTLQGFADLVEASHTYENRHNSGYRYSRLGGKTPLAALANSKAVLSFPKEEIPPAHPLKKPETGHYHMVRLIRSDLKLNIFGELFPVSPDFQFEYLVATVDVKEQRLKVFLDKTQVDEFEYKLR
jgi:hypothetical protein